METQTSKKVKSVGFRLPWEVEDFIGENLESDTTIEETPIIIISNDKSSDVADSEKTISKAHAEIKGRILITEAVITGETFSSMEKDKKQEFIDELKFLTAVDAELSE